MSIDYYKQLEALYNALPEPEPQSSSDDDYWPIFERAHAIINYIHINAADLSEDLAKNKEHAELYQRISNHPNTGGYQLRKDIQSIKQHSDLLQIAATPDKLTDWLGTSDQNPQTLLSAFERKLKRLADLAPIVSKIAIIALKLETPDQINTVFKGRTAQLMALAHLVNANKIPLKDLNLSKEDLIFIAPQLLYVDSRDIAFKDEDEATVFINKCSNGLHFILNSDKITELRLPTSSLTLNCSNCKLLESIRTFNCNKLLKIEVSNCGALQTLICAANSSLTEIKLSNCEALKSLRCGNCDNLKELEFSNCAALQELNCSKCKQLTGLDCTNCQALQELFCHECLDLKEIKLSNCRALRKVECNECFKLKEIDCTNCRALQTFNCSKCPELEAILGSSLPSCRDLDHHECPHLRQLPQLPAGVNVICYGSIDFVSFKVDPDDLKTNPLQVLCHLGDVILRYKRMPNIVYLNSPGLDHGGLRRQLVATLMQNLFEKKVDDIPFPAFEAVGMLIALAALGSLPLGRSLNSGFYYALLNSEEDTPEKQIQSLALYGVPDEEIETVDHNLTLPITWAARGFRAIADPKKFREIRLDEFVNRIAGIEVNWENFDKLAVYKGAREQTIKGYFKTFFEKNPHKVNDMVELFTSSRALGAETIKILIDDTLDKNSLFSMSTCFQQVKLPVYDTYEVFEEKLLKTMEHTLGHFDKA